MAKHDSPASLALAFEAPARLGCASRAAPASGRAACLTKGFRDDDATPPTRCRSRCSPGATGTCRTRLLRSRPDPRCASTSRPRDRRRWRRFSVRDNRAVEGHVSSVTESWLCRRCFRNFKARAGKRRRDDVDADDVGRRIRCHPRACRRERRASFARRPKNGICRGGRNRARGVAVKLITHAIGSSGTGTEGGTVISP